MTETHEIDRAALTAAHPERDYYETNDSGELVPLVCPDCQRPTFWDETAHDYRHAVDPERGCFLIRPEDETPSREIDGSSYARLVEHLDDVEHEIDFDS